jgi:hypothetical protein
MPLFFTFYFSIYDTLQNMVQYKIHITQSYIYDEAGVCEWNCWYYTNHITFTVVMRLRQAGLWHGTGGLKVTVSSGNFGLSPQLGLEPAPLISEALVERYLNGSQLILGN